MDLYDIFIYNIQYTYIYGHMHIKINSIFNMFGSMCVLLSYRYYIIFWWNKCEYRIRTIIRSFASDQSSFSQNLNEFYRKWYAVSVDFFSHFFFFLILFCFCFLFLIMPKLYLCVRVLYENLSNSIHQKFILIHFSISVFFFFFRYEISFDLRP